MKYSIGYIYDLILIITQKELKVRYKNSILGYVWSVANPLLFAMIYYFIFKLILRVQIPNYTAFLITGLFPWQWFAGVVSSSLLAYVANAQIIKKTLFPRSIIPLSNVLMEFLHFICTIPVIIIFLQVYGISPTVEWFIGIPIISLGQIILLYGFSLIFSTLNLFLRDLERFITLGIMLLFYCTPVLYSSDLIPEKYKWVEVYNPLTAMINSWRDLFLNGYLNWGEITSLYIIGVVTLIIGFIIFNKLKFRFAEIL
ncbi:ABC transporter permease [Citrobacter werkmanii]|uniref:Transport permease protein n=1 Tax=Citrobacter youngae TaxID=133448 RepID=A0A2Z4BVL4_9ENTR|nr:MULTISPECIES: ABC transporter permease [Citrobacter]AWU66711.1 ABC transporter permease [Citrobacter youngae]ATF49041.1 ABC transporter permease [Citrobacter werkmanii]EJB8473513.1 ABC transporter permease [Citrobacter freundii]EJB8559658.1 ABC transporter permease [Citrobacter freundii]QLO04752.1 ABC transporter permease [Citrobacter freundii]